MDDVIQSHMLGTPSFAILAAQPMCAQWGDVSSTTELAAVRSNDGSAIAQTNCNVEGSVIHPEANSTSEILLLLARECVYVRV